MDKYNTEIKELKKIGRKELKDFNFLFDSCFEIYFEIINILNMIQNRGYWHCFCEDFQGCKLNYNRGNRYCFLCQIEDHYDIEDVEEINILP